MSDTNAYRYERFTTRMLLQDMKFSRSAPASGDDFPEFDLPTTDGHRIRKSDFVGERPLLMILGSNTCPMTASSIPSLKRLHSEFGDEVAFVMLNVREAHPGEKIPQPETFHEKQEHARMLKERYDTSWTIAVDDLEGALHRALDGKPNVAYLMGSDGKVVFRAQWASDEGGLREALQRASDGQTPVKAQSRAMMVPMAKAMGHVHRVMRRAGPQAERDLLRAGTPMALAGMLATLFSPLSHDRRGIAAVTTMGVSMTSVIGIAIGIALL